MSLRTNKRKGSRFETRAAERLAALTGLPVERRHLAGTQDRGDLAGVTAGPLDVVVECKNTTRMNVTEHLREARREAENAGAALGIVVQHRPGIGIETDNGMDKQLVLMTLADLATLLNVCNDRDDSEEEERFRERYRRWTEKNNRISNLIAERAEG